MALAPGTRLGAYEILTLIGSGGMGEVYRAKDTRLGRDVALKILPPTFTGDPDRLARFRREAQVLASMNHPHICAIFGLDEANGTQFLVLELVDGQSLARRIARGRIPVDEALGIAKQIAEALEAAHEKGIIHRDLKPANVALTSGGNVKVLDFGLAKATEPASGTSLDVTNSPTITPPSMRTGVGVILGTAAYMSPEQAKGRLADKRCDIWAFGCVLFEMLTGKRAFAAEDVSDTLAFVLTKEPDFSLLPANTPATTRTLLRRCIEKDPTRRLHDIADARLEIEDVIWPPAAVIDRPPAAASVANANRLTVRAVVATAILAIAAGAWWLGRRSSAAAPAWSEFTQLTDASGVETAPSISPDGGSFAYSSAARGSWDVYVQRVGGRNPVLIAGDPERDEVWPAFSPDGKQIAFSLSGGTGGIFVVGATGESVRRLTDFGSNPAWAPDGQHIVFSSEEVRSAYDRISVSTLWTVDVAGDAPIKIDGGDAIQPAWSPSGRRIAFWQVLGGQRDLATIPAGGGPHVVLTADAAVDWAPAWSPDGRFLYFASDRGGPMGIWRIAVDEVSGRARGAPEPIASGVDMAMDLPHLSGDGTALIFRSKIQSVNPAAIAFDPGAERASEVRLLQHRTGNLSPTDVSPDGRWIALFNIRERQEDIFIMRPDGTGLSRLTDDLARDRFPRFTPDSAAVTFYSNKSGSYDGWSIRLDGSNRTRLTALANETVFFTMFAPDGLRLMATVVKTPPVVVIGSGPWPITRKTVTEIKNLSVGGGSMFPAYWSRDGRWLAGPIQRPSGGVRGNALYNVAEGTVRQLSDDAGDFEMAWMPGDTRVLYFTTNRKLMIQDIGSLERHEIAVKLPFPPDDDFTLTAAPDGRTLYYGAQQVEANIWKVERPKATR